MPLPLLSEQAPPTSSPHEAEKHQVATNLAGIRRKIGVHSGKGGVGKTFLAVNLALALAASGKSVGLLDADVDCPNVARFLNLRDGPLSGTPEGRIHPLEYRGMKIVSTHFMTDDALAPMIVRGPIKHKILAELLSRVEWGTLDVLLTDLPPGTADVPMSSMMIGDMDGILIVTTPQKEAVMDARKSVLMSRDLGVPVLGVVENMSGEVFGAGAGKRLSKELGVPFLGTIPLSREIRVLSDAGKAAFVEKKAYGQVAERLMHAVTGERLTMQRSFWRFGR